MKICVRRDHRTTWKELYDALAYLSRDALEPSQAREADSELEDRVSKGVATLGEELAWLRIANEVSKFQLN